MNIREKADEIFAWGLNERHGNSCEAWKTHSFSAAKVAATIAEKAGMDADSAYAMGLLHDIGRYDINAKMNHIILGYRKLMNENLPEIARICLTHSFHPKETVMALRLSDEKDTKFVQDFVSKTEYDEYDRLIQMADYMAGTHGVTIIERRFCSVLYRHGMPDPRGELINLYEIKKEFDKRCGVDIYTLFKDDISEVQYRGIPGGFGKIEDDGNFKIKEGK